MKYTYKTHGTCSYSITVEVENNKLVNVIFDGGCNGNLKGIDALCRGMEIDEVIERLGGIRCGFKKTSCPDQLACALKEFRENKK